MSQRALTVIVVVMLLGACGGIGDLIDESLETMPGAETGSSGGGSETRDEGDPTAFRLARAGWENSCAVIDADQVAAATGFTVVDARESSGCNWMIEPVDPAVIGDPIVGWQPMRARDVPVQWEASGQAGSSVVLEQIEGLGTMAFWRGNDVNALGEVWVETDQIGFRVTNQFAGPNYTGDPRAPLEALAAELVAALATLDVIAASGDAASALIPAERVDLPDGIVTLDDLIDELSAVPLPDGTVIGFGDVYPDRASQDAYTDLPVGDAVRFFLEALPAAGFEITSGGTAQTAEDVLEYVSQSVSFIDPDGNRGDIGIREGAFAPSQLNIQIFLP
ncbi:MAG TPA: hypothetical protein VLB67_13245 [Acidimicrobiia bacterium]|nr:hypothetical protein [Acidimicrobiia bacterium]